MTPATNTRVAYTACPLCGSKDFTARFKADCSDHPLYKPTLPPVMVWCVCEKCGHIFTDGYFSDEDFAILLSDTLDYQSVGFDVEKQRESAARIVARVNSYLLPDRPWLDVGFGSGALLFAAQEAGYVPVGIDLRAKNVEDLARLNIEAHCIDLTALDHSGRYGVISMSDVLEHMPFPGRALAAAHRLIAPGGVLFLSMPNCDSIAWRLATERQENPYWIEIEHYHNFSRKRLYALLEESGFTPEDFAVSERYRLGMEIIARRNA